eukprot:GHVU01061397.1.p1 GENE.GHVU01061397.1~~GHVU01061397.1.p1  ORF type:complete len:189 (-),score=19.65 GHVU01061397.1:285-851(-)
MFKKSKSKSNVNLGSKDSLDELGYKSSSSETLTGSREMILERTSNLTNVSQFEVYYLGKVQDVNLGGIQHRDPDIQLIDKVEEAQLEGKMALLARQEDLVTFTVSKHGVKVLTREKKVVLQRHPLHTVAQVILYSDSFEKNNVALKLGTVGKSVYNCYVFQCQSEHLAQSICQSVKATFEALSTSQAT